MKRTLFIILSVLVVFLILGTTFTWMTGPRTAQTFSIVGNRLPGGFGGGGAPEMAAPPMPAADMDSYAAEESGRSLIGNDAVQQQTQERLVIENADLAIVVKDPATRKEEISALAKELGGYVVSSSLSQVSATSKKVLEASIYIRVPSERLDEALEKIKEGAVDVTYENRTGQDVTSEYVDLQAQLKAKQAAEKKLLEIMDRATRAEDVLAIYLQVQNVQTEIEQLTARIKYLKESADLSAIQIRLIAEESTQPIQVGPWKPQGAAKQAIQDLVYFSQNFVDFLIRFVLYTLPALILIAIPIFLVYLGGRAVYRGLRKTKANVKDAGSEEIKG